MHYAPLERSSALFPFFSGTHLARRPYEGGSIHILVIGDFLIRITQYIAILSKS